MRLIEQLDIISAARTLAHTAHSDQMYGDKPYWMHLLTVTNVLFEFGFGGDVELLAAAWLHDAIEDAGVTREQIADACNERVTELVWHVTDEPGANRKVRKAATYPKIAADPKAVILKLADRIANVRESLENNPQLLHMYRREHPAFAHALREASPESREMWKWLDNALAVSGEIDTADTVYHAPTGETWTVACVQGDRLSWIGWPEGMAGLADCTLIEKATPEARQKLLEEMAAMDTADHRQRYAAGRLAHEEAK